MIRGRFRTPGNSATTPLPSYGTIAAKNRKRRVTANTPTRFTKHVWYEDEDESDNDSDTADSEEEHDTDNNGQRTTTTTSNPPQRKWGRQQRLINDDEYMDTDTMTKRSAHGLGGRIDVDMINRVKKLSFDNGDFYEDPFDERDYEDMVETEENKKAFFEKIHSKSFIKDVRSHGIFPEKLAAKKREQQRLSASSLNDDDDDDDDDLGNETYRAQASMKIEDALRERKENMEQMRINLPPVDNPLYYIQERKRAAFLTLHQFVQEVEIHLCGLTYLAIAERPLTTVKDFTRGMVNLGYVVLVQTAKITDKRILQLYRDMPDNMDPTPENVKFYVYVVLREEEPATAAAAPTVTEPTKKEEDAEEDDNGISIHPDTKVRLTSYFYTQPKTIVNSLPQK